MGYVGRPPLTDEDLATIGARIPESTKKQMKKVAKRKGMTMSQFIRKLIEDAIVSNHKPEDV